MDHHSPLLPRSLLPGLERELASIQSAFDSDRASTSKSIADMSERVRALADALEVEEEEREMKAEEGATWSYF